MTKQDVKGKVVHAIIEGDRNSKSFMGLIMNPSHTISYGMTEKYKDLTKLQGAIVKWGKAEKVKEIIWVAKK